MKNTPALQTGQLEALLHEGRDGEAMALLDKLIADYPGDDSLFFTRGKLHWRHGQRPAAMADYLEAVRLNPDSPAAVALAHARDIDDFFNPDLFNP